MTFLLKKKVKIQFRTFLKKKIKFLGFHGVVLVKTFPLMYQLLCRTDIDEAMVISFLGVRTDGQTDRVLESSHGNMSAQKKKFQLKAQNWEIAVDPYMPPRRMGMHKNVMKIRENIRFSNTSDRPEGQHLGVMFSGNI